MAEEEVLVDTGGSDGDGSGRSLLANFATKYVVVGGDIGSTLITAG